MAPNRIATYLTAGAGLAAAIAVPLANLDTTSLVGVMGGLTTILGIAYKWLDGWQKHEASLNPVVISQIPLAAQPIMAGTMGPSGPGMVAEEAGDAFDGLPHIDVMDPSLVPADNVDGATV